MNPQVERSRPEDTGNVSADISGPAPASERGVIGNRVLAATHRGTISFRGARQYQGATPT